MICRLVLLAGIIICVALCIITGYADFMAFAVMLFLLLLATAG